MNRLNEKVVVVTGGAGLIGKEFVSALLAQGAQVVVAEKDIERAKLFIGSMESFKDKCHVQVMDITCSNSVSSAVSSINDKLGKIDALVNNAYPRNGNYGANFFDVRYEDFCENISMNIGGYFLCSQKFAEFFSQQGHGNIINIASIYGCIAPKFEIYNGTSMTMPVEYAAIKSSLIHLSKYMAKSFKGMNIRVNCLSPGGVLDGHSDVFKKAYAEQCINKGMLDSSDLVGGLIFLLSDDSLYVNGQNLVIDDGFTL